jgi:putative ABC transport system permease protein
MLIRPRWEKVLTDLWGNLTRSILVVASIGVGLLAIGIITTIYVVISVDMRAGYTAINPANINIQTDLINDDTIHHIGNIQGVRQVEGVRSVSLRVINTKGLWQNIDIKAFKDMDQLPINQLRLIEGRWPKTGEIVIDKNRLVELNAKVGDWVQIELPSDKIRSLHLVGIVQDQTIGAYGNGGGFFNAPIQSYIHPDTLDKLEQQQTDLFNGAYVTINGNGSDLNAIQEVSTIINHDLKFNGVNVISIKNASSSDHPNAALMDAVSSILIILGMLSVFLSGFLVTNTLQALLTQQTQQIGIMKSVGARRTQIAGVYITLILVFGILGFLVAMPLAYLAAFPLLDFLASKLNIVLRGPRLEFSVVALQAGLAIFMPLFAAWQPIWDGSKISVINALTGGLHSGPKKKRASPKRSSKPNWVSRLLMANLPQTIAVRNTFRKKGRLALTLITLSLGGAIFIATFNVRVSLDQYISQIRQYFIADINLVLKRPYRDQEILQILDRVPGVRYIETWTSAAGRMILDDDSLGERVSLIGPPANSVIIKPVITSGRWIQSGDRHAIVLSDTFQLHFPALRLGSPLRLKINDKNTDWVVVGFFQLAGKMSGYTAYTNYDYLAELTNNLNRDFSFQILGDKKGLSAAEQEQLKKSIETQLDANNIRVANLTTGNSDSSSSSGGLATLTVFLLFMAVLIAIVGSIGLAGTMSMNVLERTREIGILRSIGASDSSLMRIVLSEGLTIGLISYGLGALLSIPITRLLGDSVINAIFGNSANLAYTPQGYLIWLALVVVLSVFASLIPARNAAQLTIREVLSYE